MAFKPVNLIPGVGKIKYICEASTSYTLGNLLVRVPGSGTVSNAVDNTTNAALVEAIVTKTETVGAATAYVTAIPLQGITYVIADCTNNTADNQLNKAHLLTSRSVVNNSSTHTASSAAVFVAISKVGADTDKQLFGYLVKSSQTVN